MERTKPKGRVIGIDIIPAQPPKGVSTIQGNFLSPSIQQLVKDYLVEYAHQARPSKPDEEDVDDDGVFMDRPSYIDVERAESFGSDHELSSEDGKRLVDVRITPFARSVLTTLYLNP